MEEKISFRGRLHLDFTQWLKELNKEDTYEDIEKKAEASKGWQAIANQSDWKQDRPKVGESLGKPKLR